MVTKTAPALARGLKVLSDDPEWAGLVWGRPTGFLKEQLARHNAMGVGRYVHSR